MIRTAPFLGLALLAAAAFPAAAETRNYDLPAFERIDVSAGIHLIAAAGGPQSVEVTTNGGDFSDLQIKVKDGVLIVTREWNRLRWHEKKADYKVVVTARALTALEASSGSYSTLSKIDSRNFTLDLSSGSSAVLNGRSDVCTVDISSGANLDARDFICESANIDVSSGGHGEIAVRTALIGDASSGGRMAVLGSPQRVNIDKSSGGQIKIKAASTAKND